MIDLDLVADERGFFARTFCESEFRDRGLETRYTQSNISLSARRGTLRGLHFQNAPDEEVRLVRCTRGAVFDVVVDLRPQSPTFRRWFATELTASNRRLIYIPKGVAHGFLTLEDDTEMAYMMSAPYSPASAAGVRWNDPAFGIEWPIPVSVIAERDRTYPDFVAETASPIA